MINHYICGDIIIKLQGAKSQTIALALLSGKHCSKRCLILMLSVLMFVLNVAILADVSIEVSTSNRDGQNQHRFMALFHLPLSCGLSSVYHFIACLDQTDVA